MKNVLNFLGNILSYLNPFSDNFILKRVINFLVDMLNYLNPFSENFLGLKLIELLGNLLKRLFVPENNYFSNLIEEFKILLSEKIPYDAYIQLFGNLKDVSEGNPAGLNVGFGDYQVGDKTISTESNWVKFDFILKHKQIWFQWCRGFSYIFFIIYNINQFIKLINKGSGIANAGKVIETKEK